MREQPLVSVAIATYNRDKYLERAIKSVWDQTYKNREIIIIDDSSTDRISELVDKLQKKKT